MLSRRPGSRALFCSPDSRPRIAEFVDAVQDAGFDCAIDRVDNGCAMMRRLRCARPGFGANQSFSFYTLTRRDGA